MTSLHNIRRRTAERAISARHLGQPETPIPGSTSRHITGEWWWHNCMSSNGTYIGYIRTERHKPCGYCGKR